MKKAFMRGECAALNPMPLQLSHLAKGVCALNMEAMSMFRNPDTAHQGASPPTTTPPPAPQQPPAPRPQPTEPAPPARRGGPPAKQAQPYRPIAADTLAARGVGGVRPVVRRDVQVLRQGSTNVVGGVWCMLCVLCAVWCVVCGVCSVLSAVWCGVCCVVCGVRGVRWCVVPCAVVCVLTGARRWWRGMHREEQRW